MLNSKVTLRLFVLLRHDQVLIFFGSVLNCVIVLVKGRLNNSLYAICDISVIALNLVGYLAVLSTSTQLGLDQMRDASSENTALALA